MSISPGSSQNTNSILLKKKKINSPLCCAHWKAPKSLLLLTAQGWGLHPAPWLAGESQLLPKTLERTKSRWKPTGLAPESQRNNNNNNYFYLLKLDTGFFEPSLGWGKGGNSRWAIPLPGACVLGLSVPYVVYLIILSLPADCNLSQSSAGSKSSPHPPKASPHRAWDKTLLGCWTPELPLQMLCPPSATPSVSLRWSPCRFPGFNKDSKHREAQTDVSVPSLLQGARRFRKLILISIHALWPFLKLLIPAF